MAWQQLTLHIDAADLPRTEALLRLAGAVWVALEAAAAVIVWRAVRLLRPYLESPTP